MEVALDGLLNVLKPPGMTSHDVVQSVRRILGTRRVGHTGTLDPAAAGVLSVCVGRATRLVPFLQEADKEYRAEVTFGVATDTQDAGGRTVRVETGFAIPWPRVDEALAGFVGTIRQVPPMTSAIRVKGERLYEAARQGREVERPARTVEVYDARMVAIIPEDAPQLTFGGRALIDVTCGKGTYVRTICADLGERLGCGAHCSFLVRTRNGAFRLEESVTLEELETAARERRISEYLLPLEAGLQHLPAARLEPEAAARAAQGGAVGWPSGIPAPAGLEGGDWVRVLAPSGKLLAIAEARVAAGRIWLKPVRVLA